MIKLHEAFKVEIAGGDDFPEDGCEKSPYSV